MEKAEPGFAIGMHCNACGAPDAPCSRPVSLDDREGNILVDRREMACHACWLLLDSVIADKRPKLHAAMVNIEQINKANRACQCWLSKETGKWTN